MQIPQELIDIIIDMVSVSDEATDSALRSCALVSPAFALPAQRKLSFSLWVFMRSSTTTACRPSFFLSAHRHICVDVHGGIQCRSLHKSSLRCHHDSGCLAVLGVYLLVGVGGHPTDMQRLTRVLRCLSPRMQPSHCPPDRAEDHTFADAMELESLLGNSTGLREVSLESISSKSLPVVRVPSSRSIALDSLEITAMTDEAILKCILDAFTTVDVKHLHFLRFERAAYDDDSLLVGDTSIGHNKLQSIHLNAYYADNFGRIIASLAGQLSDLRRLIMDVRD
ncbi:hypothetical protein C8R47DRAFT_1314890 [Mycena vitilis]|nr:hypothetical protein C8R47DRAFT_1314890 [Mycena vitilis]